jgi:hypothetical protein
MAAIRNTKGFGYAAQATFSNEPKREPSLSSRAKAANYATEWNIFPNGINDQNALSHRNFRLHCRAALFVCPDMPQRKLGSRPPSRRATGVEELAASKCLPGYP